MTGWGQKREADKREVTAKSEEVAKSEETLKNKHFFDPKQPVVESSSSALISLSFYSFLMFTVPIGVFFLGTFLKRLIN